MPLDYKARAEQVDTSENLGWPRQSWVMAFRAEVAMARRQAGFWGVEERLRELSAQGDPLEKLSATVDFEMFRAKGGRPGFDTVLKFRMLTLQAMHGLSLEQTE